MLTPRQERFCLEYIIDLNATQAAIRAGYSAKTAQVQSSRLLSNVMVSARVAELTAAVAERLEVTAERVIEELGRIAFADIRDVVTFGPRGIRLKASQELTEEQAAAVAEVKQLKGRVSSIEVKMHDKVAALMGLARRFSLFKDKVELESNALDTLRRFLDGERKGA